MQILPNDVKSTLLNCISDMASNCWQFTSQPSAFTRKRKISFEDVLLSVISMQKSSSRHEMLKYFDFNAQMPTLSALIQRRHLVTSSAFEHLFYRFTNSFSFEKAFKGYRIFAVDGSDICIPRNPADKSTYRISDPYGKGFNMLHLNASYDLLNRVYTDISLQAGNEINEYAAICDMIEHYSAVSDQKAIFIADRGFGSFNVFAHAIENGTYFLIRAKDTGSHNLLSTLQLPDTKEFDLRFERWLTRRNTKTVKAEPQIYKSIAGRVFDYLEPKSKKLYYISFRIVRFLLPNGKTETIYTNLPKEEFSADELRHLYHLRWGIETSFRSLKYSLGMLFFHSRNKDFVFQEIYAKIILYNFCEIITGLIIVKKRDCKYTYQINHAMAISICIEFLRRRTPEDSSMAVEKLLNNLLVPVRIGRSYPRFLKARTASTFLYR